MERGVDFNGIFLNHCASGFVVACGAYALYFGQEFAEESAEGFVVVDFDECLAVAVHEFDNVVVLTVLVCPFGDELAVAHMGFFNFLARLDALQLGEHAVEDIFVVFGLVCVGIVEQPYFEHFGVCEVVEREEVGACFLDSGTVLLEGVFLAGHQAS